MPSRFPGMDPYLEADGRWPDFHVTFMPFCRRQLLGQLPTGYDARIEERVQLIADGDPDATRPARGFRPDLSVVRSPVPSGPDAGGVATAAGTTVEPVTLAWADVPETEAIAYIAVRTRHDARLVTAIELLSPSNKEDPGRRDYRAEMEALRRRGVNVVELDLLLGGRRLTMAGPLPPGDFYAYVGRADRRPNCDVYGWSIRRPLPGIPVPLRSPDPDAQLDLSAAFAAAFDNAEYDRSLPYGGALAGPLSDADRAWAAERAASARRTIG